MGLGKIIGSTLKGAGKLGLGGVKNLGKTAGAVANSQTGKLVTNTAAKGLKSSTRSLGKQIEKVAKPALEKVGDTIFGDKAMNRINNGIHKIVDTAGTGLNKLGDSGLIKKAGAAIMKAPGGIKNAGKKIIGSTMGPIDGSTGYKALGGGFFGSAKSLQLGDAIGQQTKMIANQAAGVLRHAIKKTPGQGVMGYKATGLGMGLLIAGNAGIGVKQAGQQFNAGRRGQGGQTMQNAPTAPTMGGGAYANNGGATGDLALALHKLRRG